MSDKKQPSGKSSLGCLNSAEAQNNCSKTGQFTPLRSLLMEEQEDPHVIPLEASVCEHPSDMEAEQNLEVCENREQLEVPPLALSSHELSEGQQMVSEGSDNVHSATVTTDTSNSCLTDMDCPVCFTRYDIYRVPKELLCKHSFCVVCLKLLVHKEMGSWLITCPICRAPTVVFGGLVCTLQNQELLMSKLQNPEKKTTDPEASIPPQSAVRLDGTDVAWISEEESHGSLRIAAKRLVILLLMLLILLVIILQFIYTGIMKWVLGCILGVVIIITIWLCFNPYCRGGSPGVTSQEKDNQNILPV